MLGTDMYGDPCKGNPLLAVTGAGSPAYCARGAFQPAYTVTTHASARALTVRSIRLTGTVAEALTDSAASTRTHPVYRAISYTINWGDGHVQTVRSSTTSFNTSIVHSYARAGRYRVIVRANLTVGRDVYTNFVTAA